MGEYGDFHAQYVQYLAKGISISNTAIVTMCSAISQLGAFIHAFRALTFAPARLSCAMFMVELITSIFDRLATLCACVRFLTPAVSEQCFTSPPTQYRLYGRRFLQVKRPDQQYQSTEGRSTKYKENNENN